MDHDRNSALLGPLVNLLLGRWPSSASAPLARLEALFKGRY